MRGPKIYLKPRRKRRRGAPVRTALVFAALPVAIVLASAAPEAVLPSATHEGVAARIVDGDTLYLEGVETRIRLWGLDAPERDAPGGSAATRALKEIAHGEHLTCRQVDTDRYGRIVGQCFLPDGRDIAALMIARGAATEYVRYSGGHYASVTAD
jgi:endonuclease YncB( thermonuclease family)